MRLLIIILLAAALAACTPGPGGQIPPGWTTWNHGKAYDKILAAPTGAIWFVQEKGAGVDVLDPASGAWSPAPAGDPCCPVPLAWDSNGVLWSGGDNGLSIQSGEKPVHLTTKEGLPSNKVTAVAFAPDHTAWIGTSLGIASFDGQKITGVTSRAKGQLGGDIAYFIKYSSDGNLWVGSDLGVAFRTPAGAWSRFRAPELFLETMQKVTGMAETAGGVIWLATYGDGAYRFEKGIWKQVFPNSAGDPPGSENLTSVVASAQGEIYFGTDGQGLVHYDGKTWSFIHQSAGLASDTVNDVYIDKSGLVWVATSDGVSRFKP